VNDTAVVLMPDAGSVVATLGGPEMLGPEMLGPEMLGPE